MQIGLLSGEFSSAETHALKDNVDLLAPFVTCMFNKSLASGTFPTVFKIAVIAPRLKKPSLDPTDPQSYRPISNLSVLSKTLERLVARQLIQSTISTCGS